MKKNTFESQGVTFKSVLKLECMECGKKFKRSGTKLEYKCPGCGGYDIDLDYA